MSEPTIVMHYRPVVLSLSMILNVLEALGTMPDPCRALTFSNTPEKPHASLLPRSFSEDSTDLY
jgi:hypothetical protein